MMDILLEKILLVDKKDSPFDFSKTIRDFWFDLIKKEQEFKGITFDLENDESKGDTKEVTLNLKHKSGDSVKVIAQLFSAGGDWQNPVGYFRCQNTGAFKVKFIVIPGPEVNKNLVKSKKGKGYTASEEGDFVNIDDIEKELWKGLEEELNDRMKPEIEEWDVNYKAMRMFESSIDFNQQLRQVSTIEDIEKLVEEAESQNYSLYARRSGSWIFSFRSVTNPKKVRYLLDSGKVGMCLISNLYKFAKFVLEKGISKVKESSIDFPQVSLDLIIWDKQDDNYTLREDVKDKILAILKQYPDVPLLEIAEEIHIVGSLCTNQFLDTADCDVHIVPTNIDEWDEEETNKVIRWFNENRDKVDGRIENHLIEVYIQLNPNQDLMSDGCYNLLEDKWLVGPKIVSIDIDPYKDFSHIADDIRDAVEDADKLFGELKRDAIDFEVIQVAMERMSGEDKDRLLQKLQDKLDELETSIEALYKEKGEWTDARRRASKPETPEQALKDVELVKNWEDVNATFKFINRYRYMRTINNLKELLADEEITPDEVEKIKSIMGV